MGLSHSLKGAHLQASWAKNQVIKKSDWTIIIAMPSLREALPRACELELFNLSLPQFLQFKHRNTYHQPQETDSITCNYVCGPMDS